MSAVTGGGGPANVDGHRSLWALPVAEREQLMRVASGEAKADVVIRDGNVVNVYTGELQERCTVAIKGSRVAYIGTEYAQAIGPATEIVDAAGKVVIPGLIDGHTHLFSRVALDEFIGHTLPTGTTTVITETFDLLFAAGLPALGGLIEAFRDQPIKLFATAPAFVSLDPPWAGITPGADEYAAFMNDDIVLGIGESYWTNTLRDDGRLLEVFALFDRWRKSLEGHTAGAHDRRLQSYLASGQTSCHEPIKAEEVRELLRLGAHVLLRAGTIRDDLAVTGAVKDMGIELRRLAVCSDTPDNADLCEGRYMNAIVQRTIETGFDPILALQMASLNVAEHFHLDYWIGGLAPGRFADLAILPDLRQIEPELVVSNGRIVSREGASLVAPNPVRYPAEFYNSVRLRPDYRAADFMVAAPGRASPRAVHAIQQISDLVTHQGQIELPVVDGELRAQPERDILKVAAIERRKGEGERFVGFVTGHGLRRGAMATTLAWDSTDLLVIGADEADMAAAVNRLVQNQGGVVVCAGGKVLAETVAELCGVATNRPLGQIVAETRALQEAAASLGSPLARHLLSLDTLSTAAIPYFRVNHGGYYQLRDGKRYGLFV